MTANSAVLINRRQKALKTDDISPAAGSNESAVCRQSMKTLTYRWRSHETSYALDLVHIPGTNGEPYLFGEGEATRRMEVGEFWIATTPVTQALWVHVMGSAKSPAVAQGPNLSTHRSRGFAAIMRCLA